MAKLDKNKEFIFIAKGRKRKQSFDSVRNQFIRKGYSIPAARAAVRRYQEKKIFGYVGSFAFGIFFFAVLLLYSQTQNQMVSADVTDQIEVIAVDQRFDGDSVFIFETEPYPLSSVKMTGHVSHNTSGTVYLEHENDSFRLYSFESKLNDEEIVDDFDGLDEAETDIDFSLTPSELSTRASNQIEFSLDDIILGNYSEEHLCSVWTIETDDSLDQICYGSEDCCAFAEVDLREFSWNSSFHLAYGLYSESHNHMVSAQLLHVDYSFDPENPYSDISLSNTKTREVSFYPEFIEFEDVCVDTCSLSDMNATNYTLRVEIDEGFISVNSLSVSTKRISGNNYAPILSEGFENITLFQGDIHSINLSQHFTDPNNDTLEYSFDLEGELVIHIANNSARIQVLSNSTGAINVSFVASDSEFSVESNTFQIQISEKQMIKGFGSGLKSLRSLIGLE